MLAGHGAKVGTMSRRLSAIRFAHRLQQLPDPTANARVVAVWEGIRREHSTRPEQAAPLMPPVLWDVLDACPTTRTWKTRGRPAEPDLAGLRDRALLLVGFVAALRRSEAAALDVADLGEHPRGLVVRIGRSKTNQYGDTELVVLPTAGNPRRCPVTLLTTWLRHRRDHRRAGVPPRQQRQPGPAPTAHPRRRQRPRPTGRPPRRHRQPRQPTPRTASAPASSPTPITAAPATAPSPTRRGTAPSPASAPTSASTPPGTTTPPPSWGCELRIRQSCIRCNTALVSESNVSC